MTYPKSQWRTEGYVVSRVIIDVTYAAKLRLIFGDVLDQWRRRDPQTSRAGGVDATVLRHPNHPAYFAAGAPGLEDVLRVAAWPKLLDLARILLGEEPMFRCRSSRATTSSSSPGRTFVTTRPANTPSGAQMPAAATARTTCPARTESAF